MRTNGFICIAMAVATAGFAGSPYYLPKVGPVSLRFESARPVVPVSWPSNATASPSPPSAGSDGSTGEQPTVLPPKIEEPKNSNAGSLMANPPILNQSDSSSPTAGPLIGPMMDGGVVTPQMLLQFFTPGTNGVSREAIFVNPPGFTPARPSASSSATYIQKP